MKIDFLKGEKINLQPVEKEDLEKLCKKIVKWVNDEVVTYFMFTGQRPKNCRQVAVELEKQIESGQNAVFLIVDSKTKKPVGYAGLYDINFTARKAEFRILIGEKDFWGKGYGTEAAELLCFYGFDRLNLHRIYLGYTEENKGAGKAYEKAGYIYEGTLKDDIYRNSKYYNTIKMAVLKEDYYKKFYQPHLQKFGVNAQNKKN